MKTYKRVLLFGASGRTGQLLVKQLLDLDIEVNAVARRENWISTSLLNNPKFNIHIVNVSKLTDKEYQSLIKGMDYVLFTLGHNLSFKGVWGEPRKLVSGVVSRTINAINETLPHSAVKLVLMASTGCMNEFNNEQPPISQKVMIAIIRKLIPPQKDNELAVNLLSASSTENDLIDWVILRPDTLVNKEYVTYYTLCESPIRNAIFNPGKTSRINVANLMSRLVNEPDLWKAWCKKMPVIYNSELKDS
ncbi:SDR family oxidoreductase [Alteromonas sp. ASW11-36]|uniref:SDR family oxidoreductase n=1 Tax=Alteromonas arenosi TaxID=3055817 RepID=A0ABT7SY93_9ALTE|nr:NAD(P)-binding oxidoreductase [Alteromonas sp. ASW11-36]MDM7861151.1 SDR family oxidoreductase [Alteromonas sp. ASW11-36]